ncbi:MAG: energy transducer TonB [Pseudomonadales bacterium]|nr:energy transducer TonB [Pseudomonadales bacterium]
MHTLNPSLPRISGAMLLAALTTAALLILMHDLIRMRGAVPDMKPVTVITEIVRIPEPPPIIDKKPIQPPLPVDPPPVVLIRPTETGATGGVEIGNPPPSSAPPPTIGGILVASGDYLPIFKVRPDYPHSAQRRGIEGFVVLRFTVDELGRVIDPEIVESVPRGVFDRSALEAVVRFKYKPRNLDGSPTRVSGVLHRITYGLDKS